jgi:predicted nucleic acid-binding protein
MARYVIDASVAIKWLFQIAEATLVTADGRYFNKAQSIGQIMRLSDPHPLPPG